MAMRIHSELTRAGNHYQSWAFKGHTRNGVTRAWWAKTRLDRPPDRGQCQEASQAAALKTGDGGRTGHPETLLSLHYLNQQEALEGKGIWAFSPWESALRTWNRATRKRIIGEGMSRKHNRWAPWNDCKLSSGQLNHWSTFDFQILSLQ